MTEPHDPLRQVNYLQQCLSNDKKPLARVYRIRRFPVPWTALAGLSEIA